MFFLLLFCFLYIFLSFSSSFFSYLLLFVFCFVLSISWILLFLVFPFLKNIFVCFSFWLSNYVFSPSSLLFLTWFVNFSSCFLIFFPFLNNFFPIRQHSVFCNERKGGIRICIFPLLFRLHACNIVLLCYATAGRAKCKYVLWHFHF